MKFKCGGCGATQPCKVPPFAGVAHPTVPDCSVPGNYSGCDVDYRCVRARERSSCREKGIR